MGEIIFVQAKETFIEFVFLLNIKEDNFINWTEKSKVVVHKFQGKKVMWRVEFYPKEIDQDIGINYQLLSPDVLDIPRVFTLSIVNTEGRQVCVQESEPLYFSKFKKIELNFFSKTELFGPDREKYMPDNLLRVSCKITVCFPSNNAETRLVKDFANMVNGKYTDVEFSFKDNKITAHKCVLSARSPVFDAMFQHDFEEKKTNSVVIEDISYNTFLNMIKYIYTEIWSTMMYEETLELLVAADKYDLEHLKKKCCNFLLENIAVENCLQTLVIADFHNCQELKATAFLVAKMNFKQIILSASWSHFVKCNKAIVKEVLDYALPGY